jgi:hypothetical protein
MRYFAIGAAAYALAYFLDPENGRWRRQALRTWLAEAGRRLREPAIDVPEEAPVGGVEDGRPAVPDERPPEKEAPRGRPEPVAVTVVAAPDPEEAPGPERGPSAVAVAERPTAGVESSIAEAESPVAEAVLPPPLPPEVLDTPPSEAPAAEHVTEAPSAAPRRRRGWLIVGAVLLAAGIAAAGVAAWSSDVFDSSDDDQGSSPASALNALAERQARAISIMAQPGATRIPVVGAEERLLLIVGMEGDAVLLVSRLERAPAGRTYEIWVIEGQTPRPAGLFRGGSDVVVPLTRPVPEGATVALTLEPLGGSPSPTSTPIYTVKRN